MADQAVVAHEEGAGQSKMILLLLESITQSITTTAPGGS